MTSKIADYRPDVDGLRALAIISVLLFHAFPLYVPGGFVGVDVFFVISGYLISNIILDDIDKGRFSFATFYARRACRILPALVVVLAACLLAGWFILLPDEYQSLGKHVRSGALYISNFVLRQEAGYFDAAAETKPLLHLWSLAIEEQFYIAWPLILVLTTRRRWNTWAVILFLLAASFLYNVIRLPQNPTATFYLPGTRVWELLIGAALAHAVRYGHLARLTTSIPADARAMAGLAAILVPIAVLDKTTLFPGWWAAAPTLGAALLISAPSSRLNRAVFAHPGMVAIGLVSYPLYLWHWPLLSFAHVLAGGPPPWTITLGLVALSLVLATLTFFLVERPIRFAPLSRRRTGMALSAICLAVGGAGFAAQFRTIPPYANRFGVDRILQAAGEWEHPLGMEQLAWGKRKLYRAQGSGGTVLFVGDSNVEQYSPRAVVLTSTAPDRHKTALFLTGGGCPPIPAISRPDHPHCVGLMDNAVEAAEAYKADTVVIAAAWWAYFTSPAYKVDGAPLSDPAAFKAALASLEQTIRRFTASGRTVFVVLNIPSGNMLDPKLLVQRTGLQFNIRPGGVEMSQLQALYGTVTERLTTTATAAGAVVVDPVRYLCGTDGFCPATDEHGDPIYKDAAHLRPTYVKQHVQYLDQTLAH